MRNEGQKVDKTLHRVATKEREEIKGTTKQKMARQHNKEGGTTWNWKATDRRQWKSRMEGYTLQWMNKAWVKNVKGFEYFVIVLETVKII